MATTSHAPQPTPERFFNALNAYQQTEAIKAAIKLEIFTAIGEGRTTAAAIAERCKAAERGVRILCDYLTIHGFLSKANGKYALAADTALFLDKRSPAYLGSVADFLTGDAQVEGHRRMADAVRKGGTAKPEAPFQPDDPMWVLFAHAMKPMMMMPAQGMAQELAKGGKAKKVLDIAAGHGVFGIVVAQHNPEAQIYAVDWPKVLEVAAQNAKAMGVAARHHLLPGSAFDVEFGDGYDLVLITNFLHHFDVPTNVKFLKKCHRAMAPGGRTAILEFVPNSDRVTPPTAAAFSLIMLAGTPAGDAFTFDEIKKMCLDAGFARTEMSPAMVGVENLMVAHK